MGEIDPKWRDYGGLIVCGSHSQDLVEEKIAQIRKAREERTPFLGICFGFQLMCVEYARNFLKLEKANSMEIDPLTPDPIIVKMPELRVGIHSVEGRQESFWHNYRFNDQYLPWYAPNFDVTMTYDIAEKMRLKQHPFFVGIQFHAEYQSSASNPHPLLKEFIDVCRKQ